MSTLDTRERAVAPLGARAASAAARLEAVEAVIAAMGDRLEEPFALEQMAQIAYLSPYYFNRVFREVTGVPPRRFQMALRMVAAKRLLLTTNLSVTDICFEVGYRSLGTFTTHFGKLVGVSPRTLRHLAEHPPPLAPAIRAALSRPARAGTAAHASVTGMLTAPPGGERLIFVGLFPDRTPQGAPAACALLDRPGPFRVERVPPGRHQLVAAALPRSGDPRGYLMPDDDAILVAAGEQAVIGSRSSISVRHLALHRKRAIDPPIVLAPHSLLQAAGAAVA